MNLGIPNMVGIPSTSRPSTPQGAGPGVPNIMLGDVDDADAVYPLIFDCGPRDSTEGAVEEDVFRR